MAGPGLITSGFSCLHSADCHVASYVGFSRKPYGLLDPGGNLMFQDLFRN